MKESREFYEKLAEKVMNQTRVSDVPQDSKHRINYCQAWHNEYWLGDRYIQLIRSYNTIVAFYDFKTECLVSLGRFSMTTYQHIRKFRNNYLPHMYNTDEINVELVNWF